MSGDFNPKNPGDVAFAMHICCGMVEECPNGPGGGAGRGSSMPEGVYRSCILSEFCTGSEGNRAAFPVHAYTDSGVMGTLRLYGIL